MFIERERKREGVRVSEKERRPTFVIIVLSFESWFSSITFSRYLDDRESVTKTFTVWKILIYVLKKKRKKKVDNLYIYI